MQRATKCTAIDTASPRQGRLRADHGGLYSDARLLQMGAREGQGVMRARCFSHCKGGKGLCARAGEWLGASCQLPIASCNSPPPPPPPSPLVFRCQLPAANCQLPIVSCQLSAANCHLHLSPDIQLPVVSCQQPANENRFLILHAALCCQQTIECSLPVQKSRATTTEQLTIDK